MTYTLATDYTQISSITSTRVMVSAALLYTFTVHPPTLRFIISSSASLISSETKSKFTAYTTTDVGWSSTEWQVLPAYPALLSINFLNYGIYHAIVAWFTLICVLIIHAMALIAEIRENKQNIAVAVYYILIAVWLFGILFFYMYNALS